MENIENMISSLLTLMPLIVSILILKILIPKIVIQSSIIKDQENYNKFIDVNKLKEFNELTNLQNDKFLKLEKQCLHQEFKLQKLIFLNKHYRNNNFTQVIEIE